MWIEWSQSLIHPSSCIFQIDSLCLGLANRPSSDLLYGPAIHWSGISNYASDGGHLLLVHAKSASNRDQMLFCHWNVQMQHVYSWHPFRLLTGNKAVVKGKCLFFSRVTAGRLGCTCVPQQLQRFMTNSTSTVSQSTNKLFKVSRYILPCVSQLVMPYVLFRAKQNVSQNLISLLLWPRKRIKCL